MCKCYACILKWWKPCNFINEPKHPTNKWGREKGQGGRTPSPGKQESSKEGEIASHPKWLNPKAHIGTQITSNSLHNGSAFMDKFKLWLAGTTTSQAVI
jgi:hypothetical protein